jgi:hypothetical protein
MQPDQLIAELLARGDMNDETVVDLNRMLEAYKAGKLDPDDESYLRALHGRILNLAPEPEEAAPAAPLRLDGLTIEEWRDRALKAESELAQIEDAARNG